MLSNIRSAMQRSSALKRCIARCDVRNWRVRSKLIAVLVIPTAAFLVLAGLNVADSMGNARAFGQRADLAELAREVTALTHGLQLERDLTAGSMTDPGQVDVAAVAERQASVDELLTAFRAAEEPLYGGLGVGIMGRLDATRAALDGLGDLREAASGRSLTQQAVFSEYTRIVATLLDVDVALAESANEEFGQNARAFSALSRAKETAAQVRGTLYAIGLRGSFAFGEFQDFADLLAARDAALGQFQADAGESQQALFDNVVRGQAVLAVGRIEAGAVNRQSSAELGIDPAQWLAASTTEVELLRDVETELLDGVVAQAQDLAAAARRNSVVNGLVITVIVAVALGTSLLVAQSMARSLRRLRRAALEVADSQLPAAVEQLRTTRTGELELSVAPVGIETSDEIGEVAGAFDTVHREAVRLAGEQAALRRSINDMFVNLARRNQTLIDRQLNLIEELEHDTEDPGELDELFRLDHLATRMRRNQENLLVLADADPVKGSTQYGEPVALANLLREALAEVEDYRRVELLTSDDAMVVGYATSDVVHLLAELIENATTFSAPNTPVRIASQTAPTGYMVEIEDQGTGMTDDDLAEANQKLAEPPAIDFALSRRLGFFVVGRLAKRHRIRVQLRRSWYGGVTALVLLPDRMFLPDPTAVPVGTAVSRRGATMDLHPPVSAAVGGAGPVDMSTILAGASASPPPPGEREYTPRATAMARVSRAARRSGSARRSSPGPSGPRPPAPAGGGIGDERDRQRIMGRLRQLRQGEQEDSADAQGEDYDPLADYLPGRVQGRLAAKLEPPPPLSSPLSDYRRDDGASW